MQQHPMPRAQHNAHSRMISAKEVRTRLTLEEGGGVGVGTQKFVYQKWPDQVSPTANFVVSHDGHFGLRGQGGSGGKGGGGLFLRLLAVLMLALPPRHLWTSDVEGLKEGPPTNASRGWSAGGARQPTAQGCWWVTDKIDANHQRLAVDLRRLAFNRRSMAWDHLPRGVCVPGQKKEGIAGVLRDRPAFRGAWAAHCCCHRAKQTSSECGLEGPRGGGVPEPTIPMI